MNLAATNLAAWMLWALLALVLPGCGLGGGLRADTVATSAQKPGQIAMYVAIHEGDRAVRGLTEKNFRVREDGQDLDRDQIQQVLLPRDTVAAHHAALLVDMSGALTDDEKKRLAEAAGRFVTRARKGQPVTVLAFDGSPRIRQVATYPRGEAEVDQVQALASYRPQDPSSALHGAVIQGLEDLERRLPRGKPIRIGTLIVVARTADLAGRVSENDMADAVDASRHHVLAVSLENADVPARAIGKDGIFTASSTSSLGLALDDAARATQDLIERTYLFAYCSPARAGTRNVRVEVTAPGEGGKEISGSFDAEFHADGFTSGCNPRAVPRFDPPPKRSDDDGDGEDRRPRGAGGARSAPAETEDIVPPPDKPGYGP
jgi:hypothetical protein